MPYHASATYIGSCGVYSYSSQNGCSCSGIGLHLVRYFTSAYGRNYSGLRR